MLTVDPTALRPLKSSLTVSDPSTTTERAFARSSAAIKGPDDSARARTSPQAGVVPTTLVVQLVLPAASDSLAVDAGATAAMSGATVRLPRASASATVSVEDVPRPPRTPDELVVDPGVTM